MKHRAIQLIKIRYKILSFLSGGVYILHTPIIHEIIEPPSPSRMTAGEFYSNGILECVRAFTLLIMDEGSFTIEAFLASMCDDEDRQCGQTYDEIRAKFASKF
jgi:hypothetical protein